MKRTLITAAMLIGTAVYCDSLKPDLGGTVASAVEKCESSKPKASQNSLTQTYQGFAMTIEAIEKSDSWDDGRKVHLTAPEGDEIIVVYVSAKRKGKEAGVLIEHFELLGAGGVKGEPALKACIASDFKEGDMRYVQTMEYVNGKKSITVYVEEPELSIIFTIRKGTRLKTFKLGTLSFDISSVKVTPAEP